MAIAADKVKSRLEELKNRASKRRNESGKKPSQKYLAELNDNADLLYADQIKTME